ncbi:probable chitinase 2 [Bradysia coprophila]|uniref:probable chitinase 2 n=1 Tax=Bradysia coprophila TaxID=38358 RepID=UPI00187D9AEF|nr:probable chitinase 2 [Bradysia coprophila]
MKNILISFLSLYCFVLSVQSEAVCPTDKKAVICYWGSWSIYRPGLGNFKIEHIDLEYCTHFVYTFAGINLNGVIDSLDYHNDINLGGYKKVIALKEEYPCAKVLLAIGGWNEGSEKYSYMAEDEERRKEFVESVIRFIIHFNFDGFDINWEYPTERGGIVDDRENYSLLLEMLHKELSKRGRILTAAVPANLYTINKAYELEVMCNNLDLLNIMGYDMQQRDKTSVHAPLKRENSDPSKKETLETVVQHLLKSGCPKEKLVLGIPAFGRSYTLYSQYSTGLNALVKGVGRAGNFSQSEGFLGYNEICEEVRSDNGWKITYLRNSAAKYASKGDQWISFDDVDTVQQKVRFVKEKNLAGVMLWSIDTDDFHGDCFGESYPLLSAINRELY